jgi:ubiquinone/menaquinone biosynthesis C-methylase UbiE
MMTDVDRGQITKSAAEIYEEFFVPALFQEWASRVADAALVRPGQHVLDVACGTGILAHTVSERIGTAGSLVGLDVNDGMLAVARRKAPQIEWRQGQAEALPFENASFDAVVSQFGLMFFEDRRAAIREMVRVLRPGGRLAVAVWDSLDNTPGYAAMAKLLQKLFGEEVANGLRAPFVLGDVQEFKELFSHAALTDTNVVTPVGTARFDSIRAWVHTEIKGWVLADALDDIQFARLLKEAEKVLSSFVTADGKVTFASPAHIFSATSL